MQGHTPDPTQVSFLPAELKTLLDPKQPLYRLADRIPWEHFIAFFGTRYGKRGRPAKAIRLMVGLLILKHVENLSDEVLVERWQQNPYYQYFCGETIFRWTVPCHPTDLVHFRKRIGVDGVEEILKVSVLMQGPEASQAPAVILDTTAQEKNIQAPHDSKLYRRVAETMVRTAKREGLLLSRTYVKEIKILLGKLKTRNYPRARRKARKATKRMKIIAGRIYREFLRLASPAQCEAHADLLFAAQRILTQKPSDSGKCYALHEPQCYAMARGKDHKMWEFGTKVSIAVNSHGVVVGAMNLARNQYDGHTVDDALEQVERITGGHVATAVGDLGYRGAVVTGETRMVTPADLSSKDWTVRHFGKVMCRWRSTVEPIIGHLKQDHRLGRNFLKGWFGDEINVLLAAAGFNFRKLLRKFCAWWQGVIAWVLGLVGSAFLRSASHLQAA